MHRHPSTPTATPPRSLHTSLTPSQLHFDSAHRARRVYRWRCVRISQTTLFWSLAFAVVVLSMSALVASRICSHPGGSSSGGGRHRPRGAALPYTPAKLNTAAITRSCTPVGDAILPKRVLVTGTAGFIGFHAAAALRLQGHGVVGLDNFNPYYSVRLKKARAQLLDQQGVHTVQADLNDQEAVAEVLRLCECSHVLHLAAQAGVRYAVKNPGAYVHSNVAGFVSLMEAVRRVAPQPPAVVYASSSSVYGLNERVPFSEDDPADRPSSVYAATKKADELLAHTYAHLHGLSLTGLRFFTVYGPWGRPDMAAFAFARAILDGTPVRVFTRAAEGDDSGGARTEMWRDFTYVDDIVAGTMRALETAERSRKQGEAWGDAAAGGGPPPRLYNLGNTHPVNVSTFLSILERHLNRKASRQYVPAPATGDVMRTHADVSRASRDLGYSPRVSLDEGLARFAQWYTSYYGRGQFPEDGDGEAFSRRRRRGVLAWGGDGEGVGLDGGGGDPFDDGEGHAFSPPEHGGATGHE